MTENSVTVVSSAFPYSYWSRNCLISLYVLAVLWGSLQVVFPDNGSVYLLFTLMFATCATLWARFDALARSKPILPVVQMLYFLLWPLGSMIYLMARSGVRGFGIWLLHAFGIGATLVVVFNLTLFALHFGGLLDPRFY